MGTNRDEQEPRKPEPPLVTWTDADGAHQIDPKLADRVCPPSGSWCDSAPFLRPLGTITFTGTFAVNPDVQTVRVKP